MTSVQRWSSTTLRFYTNRLQTFSMKWQKTGNFPDEGLAGVLVPLPKPGKPQGPPANLRPIILLSILWKILAICIIKRIQEKIGNRIPLSQEAYRAVRNTTEHVFTCNILAEKAIKSECYETTILLLDMSKAFETVKKQFTGPAWNNIRSWWNLYDENTPTRCKIECNNRKRIWWKDYNKYWRTTRRLPEPNFIHIKPSRCPQIRKINNHRRKQTIAKYQRIVKTSCKSILKSTYILQKENRLLIDHEYADDTGWVAVNEKYRTEKIKKRVPAQLYKKKL